MRDYYRRVLQLAGYTRERRLISEAVEKMEVSWSKKNLFVIEAPTGYGKTTITATLALRTVEDMDKLIVAYPLRTLLEDQYSKLEKVASQNFLGKRYMHEKSSPYLVKPITLTTIDTLSMTMFGLAPEDLNNVIKGWEEDGSINTTSGHYLFSWSSVILSDIVLDEVHLVAEESKSLTYLIALLEHMISHDQRVVLMSATMPTKFKKLILDHLRRYKDRVEWMDFGDSAKEDDFMRLRKEKKPEVHIYQLDRENRFNVMREWLDHARNRGFRRALVVFNTIREAVSFYRALEGYKNRLLIHSRFTERDRRKKYEELNGLKNRDEYIVVATQVVEAGLDISSNVLITDLSPMCSIIQRFGRFLRYEDEIEGVAYIWYDSNLRKDAQQYKVYDRDLCMATIEALRKVSDGHISLHVPIGEKGYKRLLDKVYQTVDLRIDRKKLDEMLGVFTNLGDISQGVDLFMEMEGSFVRSSTMISVKTDRDVEEVAIELKVFERLLRNGLVKGQIVKKDGESIIESLPEWLIKYAKTYDSIVRKIIKHIHMHEVKSFYIKGTYSEEIGLEFGTPVDEL